MRWVLLATGLLAAPGASAAPPDDGSKVLHTEQGRQTRIVIEARGHFNRLLMDNVLHGSQIVRFQLHWADQLACLTAAHPLENLMALGALHTFVMREEPLTYHHRNGPVGAVYYELRTRNNGADAKAPVAVFGLTAGTQAAYAQRGQKIVFYENDPAIKKLAADTDEYFTYVADARKRGAEVEVRVGDKREKLKADKDQKYAAMFIDISDSFPVPRDIFTKEAVKEYFDRMTDDGLLGLHVSNRYLRLEPMFAKIAEELKLTAVVWNDDAEGRPGKTAASWVVMARSEKALGPRLASPLGKLVAKYGSGAQLLRVIRAEYPAADDALKNARNQQDALTAWLDLRRNDAQAKEFARLVRLYGVNATVMTVLRDETETGFRPVEARPGVTAWTDASADVLILWMRPEVQAVRRFLGLPTIDQ